MGSPSPSGPPLPSGSPPPSAPGAETARRDLTGIIGVVMFTGAWLVGMVAIQVVALVVVAAKWVVGLQPGQEAAGVVMQRLGRIVEDGWMPPLLLVVSMGLQFPTMLALLEGSRRVVQNLARKPILPGEDYRYWYALRPVSLGVGLLALPIGLTAGWLPGWIAEKLRSLSLLPDLGAIDMINQALTTGPSWMRAVIVVAIVVLAPVVEEAVFRGVLWRMIERTFGARGAFVGSSLLFAAYHMDPVQASALLFTAFVLGWLRLVTGSLWPGVIVHVVNNSLGVAAAFLSVDDAEGPSLLPALAAAAIATGLCVLVGRMARDAR